MAEVDLGTLTTITLETSQWTAEILDYEFREITRGARQTTHMRSTPAGEDQFGGQTFIPTVFVDPGILDIEVAYNPQMPLPPIHGQPEIIRLRFPLTDGPRPPVAWEVFFAFLVNYQFGEPLEDRATATISVKLTGQVGQRETYDLVYTEHWEYPASVADRVYREPWDYNATVEETPEYHESWEYVADIDVENPEYTEHWES